MDGETDDFGHEDIWDDSALVESWNEALAEYKVCPLPTLSNRAPARTKPPPQSNPAASSRHRLINVCFRQKYHSIHTTGGKLANLSEYVQQPGSWEAADPAFFLESFIILILTSPLACRHPNSHAKLETDVSPDAPPSALSAAAGASHPSPGRPHGSDMEAAGGTAVSASQVSRGARSTERRVLEVWEQITVPRTGLAIIRLSVVTDITYSSCWPAQGSSRRHRAPNGNPWVIAKPATLGI